MTSIEKLKVAHGITCNLIESTSLNDTRLPAMMGVRDGIAAAIIELEFDN